MLDGAAVPPPDAAQSGADRRSSSQAMSSSSGPTSAPLFSASIGSSVDLVGQLQRLCQRQRVRSDERSFVRDVEQILALLRRQSAVSSVSTSAATAIPESDKQRGKKDPEVHHEASASGTMGPPELVHSSSAVMVEWNALLDCIAQLFAHRNFEVRSVAFELIMLCMSQYGDQLTPSLRRKIFERLEERPLRDFLLRQKALRLLTMDGRNLEPFSVELGWLLLQMLEESDEQRDLMSFIQTIFRRNPTGLDFETVVAITTIICSRCDQAWSRGDIESCKKFLTFFHVLVTHDLEDAASTSVCLRTLCCMVNADGHGTWSIMRNLLNSSAAYQVLRGLLYLLENPMMSPQWVLRGAVFFVGMSCWGSQRVAKLDDIKWSPILLALEQVLTCNNGVVIFEVILALQRLIKKFGDSKSTTTTCPDGGGENKCIIVEWDIILRMFKDLRPWLSTNKDPDPDSSERIMNGAGPDVAPSGGNSLQSGNSNMDGDSPLSVSIHQTRIPKELLDTLLVVEDLVAQNKFAGEIDDFFNVLEEYLPYLNEGSTLFLLKHRADGAHPAYHINWLKTLGRTMKSFFSDELMTPTVRLEALEVLQMNLWTSRNVCEDRVIEEVLIPTLNRIYDDPHLEVRRRGIDLITEIARHLESVKFDALLDILANGITLSVYDDAQQLSISGTVSLFSSYFNHMPHTRTVRMYEIITRTVQTHRNWEVRHIALSCLLHVCEANVDFRLQWKDTQVRTSRFLYCARRAVRSSQTGACVPVSQALRALLTLISTESHAVLFRMAVEGIRKMLQNRIILTDVDVSEMALKVISCVEYQAFGRAAIADELSSILDDQTWEARPRHLSDADVVRYMSGSSRRHGELMPIPFKSSLRDTVGVLIKTRFTTMGLEILELLAGYADELTWNTRHQLIMCLVGALDCQLMLADKDLFSSSTTLTTLPDTHVDSNRLRYDPSIKRSASAAAQLNSSVGTRDHHLFASQDMYHPMAEQSMPPPTGFTSRMWSRIQSGGSHGNLFHALSSSVIPSRAANSSPRREDREQLQKFLQSLYESEFVLLHTVCNTLSLLALRIPDEMRARLDIILRSSRTCFSTTEGDFRCDSYGAVIEMLGNLIVSLSSLEMNHFHNAIEILLLGFEFAKSKRISCLAYRLLCQVTFKCPFDDRLALASLALPTLKQCLLRSNTLLVEAAIDFLMCFAYSKSFLPPSAMLSNAMSNVEPSDPALCLSRSWVYKNSILTIEVTSDQNAKLIVRRPNCTNQWSLRLFHDFALEPRIDYPSLKSLDNATIVKPKDLRSTISVSSMNESSIGQSGLPVETTVKNDSTVETTTKNEEMSPLSDEDPPENVNENISQTSENATTTSDLDNNSVPTIDEQVAGMQSKVSTKEDSEKSTKAPIQHHDGRMPVVQEADEYEISTSVDDHEEAPKTFTLDTGPVTYQYSKASLPPLPAYDGVGGSPSYFCETSQGKLVPN